MTLAEMLQDSAQKHTGKTCLTYYEQRMTYAEVQTLAHKIAQGLRCLNLPAGAKVGVLASNCREYIPVLFGIWEAGAIAVPVNAFLHPKEVEFILNDSGAGVLFCDNAHLQPWTDIKSLKQVILLDGAHPDCITFSDFINAATSEKPYPKASSQDLALIIYTSGTTGTPKGAMLSHQNMLSDIRACGQAIKVVPKDKFLVFLPLFHSFTLTVTILLPIFSGAQIVLLQSVNREQIKESIPKHRISIFVGIPTVYQLLAQRELVWWQRWLNPVRLYISGGAPLPPEVIHKFAANFRRPLLEGYGLSEASPVVSINPQGKIKPGSVGLPLPGIEVKVVDETGKVLDTNQGGELLVRGPNVMQGYWKNPEATATVIRDGWLYTGDMARIDSDGYIFIEGRKKEMLIVHGQNVYPREIEEVILRHSKVSEAAVIGVSDSHRGEAPKAFIVPRPGETVSAQDIKQHCRQYLAAYKVPHYVEVVQELPKTSTGKVLKRQLK